MYNAKITIIIPVYNCEEYLSTCLDSILKQTIEDKEIICIDDGSSDSSPLILEKYSIEYGNIKIIKQNNKGSGVARNMGLRKATGTYVAFCDADDYYADEDALKRMVNACDKNNIDICGSYRKTIYKYEIIDAPLFRNLEIINDNGTEVTYEDFQNDFDYQSFIFRRKLLTDNNIEFPDYRRYQDPPFFVKAMIIAERFWVMPVELYCYRYGHQNIEQNSKKIEYVLMGIRDNLDMAIKHGYNKLYNMLIEERLNKQYYLDILNNASDIVIHLLDEINCINQKNKNPLAIRILSVLPKYMRLSKIWGKTTAYEELENTKNQSFEIFRKAALLKTRGYSMSDILQAMGLNKIYVYGAGEIGQMFMTDVFDTIEIIAILDTAKTGQLTINRKGKTAEIDIIPVSEVLKDNIHIVITPAAAFQEISFDCIQKGIKRERLISLHTLLTYGTRLPNENINNQRQFLITGAQFDNKGAQTMLFIAISEIRKRFSDAIIWYLPVDDPLYYTKEIQNKYNFYFLLDGYDMKSQLYEIVTGLTAIIDVSGYTVSSYWNYEWYMKIYRIATNYKIPLYLMPQSFGPLDFNEDKSSELEKLLSWARVIYAREVDSYNMLIEKYRLDNVRLSKDIVLQNKSIDKKAVYCVADNDITQILETGNNIAIIPNVRNYEFVSQSKMISMYKCIIDYLLSVRKNIYIFPFANDIDACEDIYKMYSDEEHVHLILDKYDCLEYIELFKNFQYMVTSRFHSVVYAYKLGIPCLTIGWADKYIEVMKCFNQQQYMFDVRSSIKEDSLLSELKTLNDLYVNESKTILNNLDSQQKENCFDILEELMEE